MNKPMTPSAEITDGQIDKAGDTLRATFIGTLRKHRGEFSDEAVQQALGAKGLASDLLAVFRTYVERFSNMIARIVTVNRSQTPEQALTATGRKQYTDKDVVAAMPKCAGTEAKVIFFKPDASAYTNGLISDDDLVKQFALRGLKPADPYSLAKANEDDPAFADEHPNATHWKDANGKWCYAAFGRWVVGERGVSVIRHGLDWSDRWWFAGLAS